MRVARLAKLAFFAFLLDNAGSTNTETQYLHLTALVSTHENPNARFECWQISTPFSTYPTVGQSIPHLADVPNISYVELPPRSNEGVHNPPHAMFFVLLSGLAHVTLFDGDEGEGEGLWIMEGVNGLMIAADVVGRGHVTEYPSDKVTVALQIPFKDGEVS